MKSDGATVLTKEECLLKPKKVRSALRKIATPLLYVSVDMDVGARNAVGGVRFLDRQGLQEKQIYAVVEGLRDVLAGGVRLAGMDLTEFNPRKAAECGTGPHLSRRGQHHRKIDFWIATSTSERGPASSPLGSY